MKLNQSYITRGLSKEDYHLTESEKKTPKGFFHTKLLRLILVFLLFFFLLLCVFFSLVYFNFTEIIEDKYKNKI